MLGDVSTIPVVVLGVLVLLRWGLLVFAAALLLRPATSCPACSRPTLVIRRPILTAMLRMVEWRWCPACRWEGPARRRTSEDAWTATSSRSRV